MNWKLRLLIALAGLVSLAFLSGCGTLTEDENMQQKPWGEPAPFEGQVPGMPTTRG